jgi:hypothetical protein
MLAQVTRNAEFVQVANAFFQRQNIFCICHTAQLDIDKTIWLLPLSTCLTL